MRCFWQFILIIAFVLPGLISNGQTLGFKLLKGQKKVKIPFELHNNLIVIPVVLNDALPLRFVLDTGVRTAILTDKDFSDFLNLTYSKKYTISGVGHTKQVNAYITNNVTLRLPGVEGKGHAILVLEEDLLELKNYLGTDVHGILGYELFSRFVVKINFASKIITLGEPHTFNFPNRYEKIPMTIEDTKPYIYSTIVQEDGSEIRVKLMIDSGSSQSIFLDLESNKQLNLPAKNIHTYVGRGLGGPVEGYVGRLKNFKIGKYELNEMVVSYPEEDSYYDSTNITTVYRNGTIGGEVLSRFNVIFNFPGQEFYFKKNRHFNSPFTYNLSGLVIKAKGPQLKTFEISEVRENSAGSSVGIMAGDIILKVNGHKFDDLSLNEVIGLLNYKPNKKIILELKRGTEKITKEFRLRSLI